MRVYLLAALAAVTLSTACGGGGGGGGPTGPNNPTTGSVSGTVVDQTATPVPGAAVALSATGQTTRQGTTSAAGAYSFANIPVGTWTVTVTPPTGYTLGTGTGTTSVTVVGGQQASAAAITLNKTGGTLPPLTATVTMANTAFSPQNVEVRVGGNVRWTNNDQVQHNATGGNFATANLANGQTSTAIIFNTAGTFNYSCTLHAGMNGSVTVR
jgi:plastocyanin